MKMARFLLSMIVALTVWGHVAAQVVTTTPSVVTTESAPVIITFHADRGSKGLAGVGPSEAVYAHTGVISSASASPTDWQHAPDWLDNSAKYRLEYSGPDTWTLTIPSIKEYYGLTDAELATVSKLMFVFRNANGSREGKASGGGDIAVDVRKAGFYVGVSVNPDKRVFTTGEPVTISASTEDSASISLSVNGKKAEGIGSVSLTTSFTTPGSYEAIAIATSTDGFTASDTLRLLRLAPTTIAAYPGDEVKQGAVYSSGSGSATFAIAAPGKSSVLLVGSWNGFALDPAQQMSKATATVELPADTSFIKNAWSLHQPYFWTTVEGLEPGMDYTYYYLIDGTTAVCDPYAHLVLDPSSDRYISPDVFPDMPEYPSGKVPDGTILAVLSTDAVALKPQPLTSKPAQSDLMIYELLIRDFTGDGTGSGTIAGVIDRLDYIASLGVNAVELMPVMEFGGNNSWGYNPLFYFAPDKAYGTPDDYRRLVNEIHSRGMAVILDVVMNHADSRTPRQLMYEPSQNPFFNATPPHSYNAFHDWNQDNPLVFNQWADVLRYWVEEYGVDGFRFDLVKGMGDNGSYGIAWNRATNSFATPTEASTNRFNASRPERIGRLRDALAAFDPDSYFICEDLADAREDAALAAVGAVDWANVNYGAAQWAMGWSDGADLSRFYAPMDGGRPSGSTVSYAESHDEERTAYKQQRWGAAGVKDSEEQQIRRLGSLAAFMIFSPGAHMIWQFEELGDAQPVKSASGDNDTSPRKSCWELLDNPLRASLRDTYATLLKWRKDNPQYFTEETKVDISAKPSAWTTGYTLMLTAPDGGKVVLLANPLPDRELKVKSPAGTDCGAVVAASTGVSTPAPDASGSVVLSPGAFVALASDNSAGIDLPWSDTGAQPATLYTITGIKVDPAAIPAPGLYISVDAMGNATKVYLR
jgi:1,4-alpha-glucan branching enzyme